MPKIVRYIYLISMGPVFGRLTRVMTRHRQMAVAAAKIGIRNHDALDNYCLSEINSSCWKIYTLYTVDTASIA
jgi:hypothetical protein